MNATPEQYERIALWLDGEAVELSPSERALAEEVRRDEALLAGAMTEVPVPARARERARKALRSAAVPRSVVRVRFIGIAAAGAAVAAALIVAAALRVHDLPIPPPPERASAPVPVEVWIQTIARPPGGEAIAWVATQADLLEAEWAAARWAPALDRQTDAIQQEIADFLLNDPTLSAEDDG